MPEVAGNAALFIDPFRPEQITDAMFRLFSDPVLRSNLISNGFEQSGKFTWKNMAMRVLDIYNEVKSNK